MRYFEKRQGPKILFWQIEQEGVRYFVGWGTVGDKGTGQTCTRDSAADCTRDVERKIRQKEKVGFVEVERPAPTARPEPKPLRSVLDAYAEHAAKFAFKQVRRLEGLERSFHVFGGLGFEEYVLLGPTETIGLWFTVKAASHDPRRVQCFLRQFEVRHAQVFAVQVAWKLPLDEPIGPFGHAVVLAPVVARIGMGLLTPQQLFKAFPIYDCEFRGDESIAEAEARSTGRGCIPFSTWDRPPHPVLDMRIQSSATKTKAKRLIYVPNQLGPMVRRLESLPKESFLEVTSFRGELCRVVQGEGLELQLPAAPTPRRLEHAQIVGEIEAFIR